jgi:hypothetical protein
MREAEGSFGAGAWSDLLLIIPVAREVGAARSYRCSATCRRDITREAPPCGAAR